MDKKKLLFLVCGVLGVAIIALCIIFGVKGSAKIQIGFLENNIGDGLSASFKYFNGTRDKKVKFEEGKTVVIKYSLTEKSGSLSVTVSDAEGNVIDSKEGTSEGEITFDVEKTQKYIIRIQAEKAKGKYNFSWSEE